jgi:hypothetical protein
MIHTKSDSCLCLCFAFLMQATCSHCSWVCTVNKPRAERPRFRGSILCRGKIFISSPNCPDRLWGPLSNLCNKLWEFFHESKSGQNRKSDHFHSYLVLRLRMSGAVPARPHAPSWRASLIHPLITSPLPLFTYLSLHILITLLPFHFTFLSLLTSHTPCFSVLFNDAIQF